MKQKQKTKYKKVIKNLNIEFAKAQYRLTNNEKPFSYWLKKNLYYHKRVKRFYSFHIPPESTILHVNCKNGYLLDALKPSLGVGIDLHSASVEQAKELYPEYTFYNSSISSLRVRHKFDYIIVQFVTMEIDDIQSLLQELHRFCHPSTRIIIETYSWLWEPVLWVTQKLGLRRNTKFANWITLNDVKQFAYLSSFDVITYGRHTLLPINIPGVSWLLNACIAQIPLIDRLCLHQWMVLRPMPATKKSMYDVSVVITCKNEKGNIENAVLRTPMMGKKTELIFVEGGSKDGTREEIKRIQKKYPKKDIQLLVQDGKGKGDAVRKGFAHAQGDVLMILDGDLTTPPETLPQFYDALVTGKGECINGSRVVYSVESQAMVFFIGYITNVCYGWLLSFITGQRIKDTLCGTKVLFKRDYEKITKHRKTFGFFDPFGDFDLLFGAARLHLKIIDVPVRYKKRQYGKTNISHFSDFWLLLWMCINALFKFKVW